MTGGRRATALAVVAALAASIAASSCSGESSSADSADTAVSDSPAATEPVTTKAAPPTEPVETDAPETTTPATDPPTTTVPRVTGPLEAAGVQCPITAHAAIVDRDHQRAALCTSGAIVHEFPISSAWSQPDPGIYPVYAKDLNASSTFGGHFSTMTHFVAFSYGKRTGARIAFHSVPRLGDGSFVQPVESVGDLSRRGESAGCIRVTPDDAVLIWNMLAVGDEVLVIS